MQRIRIKAFLLILLFPLFSFSQPKNVILLIGDGMGLSQAYGAYTANKGQLNMFTMPITGFSKTYCADRFNTDSGAGATALAIGHKANYESIGLDSLWMPHPSLIKLAKKKGLSTSIITTCDLTHATPASFVANVRNRKMNEEIALSYLNGDVDIFIGGGLKNFISKYRKDKFSLTDSLNARGYKVLYKLDELNFLQTKNQGNNLIAGLLYDEHPPLAKERNDMLCKSLTKTLSLLSNNDKGFFIMLEGSQIDFEAHLNRFDNMVEEILDFDKAVGIAIEYAKKDKNTLVIVIADHETGGLTINGGDFKKGEVNDKWTSLNHTGVMVPIYAFGVGAENFSGVMENTDVFKKISLLLDL
ncbi:MAG: alkaline phosphatase [Bacteroidales bacterium]|nr:alkaline phosphatase [Bacteroidales bacterium]MDD4528479.1 alkaline phosphatase [Bacteroidales bacterium]